MTLNVPNNRKHVTFFFRDYSGFLVLYLGCEQHEVEFLTGESSNTTNTSEGRHIRSCAEYEVLPTQMQPSPSHSYFAGPWVCSSFICDPTQRRADVYLQPLNHLPWRCTPQGRASCLHELI